MTEDDDLSQFERAEDQRPAEKEKQSEAKPEGDKPEDEAETETTDDESEGTDDAEGDDKAGDDGESDEGEAEDEDESGDKPKKPSRSARYQRQIDRLKAQLAEVSSRSSGGPSEQDVAAEVERIIGKAPAEADFKGDYIAFERATLAYELDKRQATREVKGRADKALSAVNERRAELAEDHRERVQDFRKKVKDFDEVMSKAANLKAAPAVEDMILESDKSGHLVYYLAKNPSKLDALNNMSERAAAREIGRIEQRLSVPSAPKQTKAPPPVKPPKGGASPSSAEKDLDAYLSRKYAGYGK